MRVPRGHARQVVDTEDEAEPRARRLHVGRCAGEVVDEPHGGHGAQVGIRQLGRPVARRLLEELFAVLALVINHVAESGGGLTLSGDERLEHDAALLHRIEERAIALSGRLVVHVVVVHGHEADGAHCVALRPERIGRAETETHVALVRWVHRARDEQHIMARRSR